MIAGSISVKLRETNYLYPAETNKQKTNAKVILNTILEF